MAARDLTVEWFPLAVQGLGVGFRVASGNEGSGLMEGFSKKEAW